jgi:hypothetical protein
LLLSGCPSLPAVQGVIRRAAAVIGALSRWSDAVTATVARHAAGHLLFRGFASLPEVQCVAKIAAAAAELFIYHVPVMNSNRGTHCHNSSLRIHSQASSSHTRRVFGAQTASPVAVYAACTAAAHTAYLLRSLTQPRPQLKTLSAAHPPTTVLLPLLPCMLLVQLLHTLLPAAVTDTTPASAYNLVSCTHTHHSTAAPAAMFSAGTAAAHSAYLLQSLT